MPGVMRRAGARTIPQGDYLDKDELVRDQEPMGIKSVTFDATGSQFGPRWVCSVEPWYEGQDGPEGLVTFTNNPTRQPIFEDLQAQIEEAGNESIGPVTLIRAKTQKGFRVYTFADYDDGQAPAAVAAEPKPRPTAPAPMRVETPLPAWDQSQEPPVAPKRRGRPPGSKNRPKEPNGSTATTSTTSRSASSEKIESPSTSSRPPEREVAGQEQILSVGEATCPHCGQVVRGRVLRDESGRGVIIHPHCVQTGKAEILVVAEETA